MIIKKGTWLFTFALLILIIFLPSYTKLQDLKQKKRDLEEKIISLEEENKKLVEYIDNLTNDPFYLEKIARENMGVAREGEVIYKIKPEEVE